MDQQASLQQALLALRQARLRIEALERQRTEPIAIVGLGCRFPGGADTPEKFWELLKSGREAITEVPPDRWTVDDFYHPQREMPGKMATRWGGFISGVDQFDSDFFGISPREAMYMDPQQRVFLEVAWEALENAGQTRARLARLLGGVFVGVSLSDYARLQFADLDSIDAYTSTGFVHSIVANRLSYLLDLRGPSLALDTACSSSLVTVHLACQSLRQRECDLAIAGGVNLILAPELTISLSKFGMMAADGRCKTFDARADGFVRGDGCGAVVLKRLSDARAEGDRILALIRGSAVNQDGRTNGLTAPNGLSQQRVIRQALENAGVLPSQVDYVEAHGTGTPLGDPIEVEALAATVGQPREDKFPCVLGSVKATIGHLEAAAGIAGLIKTVLCLQHETIPPQLHFQSLNPHIVLENTALAISTQLRSWPSGARPRYAGISSFGFGGTNAHLILEEAPAANSAPRRVGVSTETEPVLVPLSARTPEALRALAHAYQVTVTATDSGKTLSLSDIAYTAGVRRDHYEHRLALPVRSHAQLAESLNSFLQGETHSRLSVPLKDSNGNSNKGPVFVFSGQGSQWIGMGQQLRKQESVFRNTLEACDALFREAGEGAWSILAELNGGENSSRFDRTEIAQGLIFAVQVALAALWRSWGLEPEAVIGHSLGEAAAAYVSGRLSLNDAVQVVFHSSRLMQRALGLGGMVAVGLSPEEAYQLAASYSDRVYVAAINGPDSTVLAGETVALEAARQHVQRRGLFCRSVRVECAFHTPLMTSWRADLVQALSTIRPGLSTIPIVSTVTGRLAGDGDYGADYWGRNIVSPVLFMPALNELIVEGYEVFLEISPHPVLSRSILDCLKQSGGNGEVLASLRREREERLSLLEAAGRLYTLGFNLNWEQLNPVSDQSVPLPTYPWQRKRYWIEGLRVSPSQARHSVSPTPEDAVPMAGEGIADGKQKFSPPANGHSLREQLRSAELSQRRSLLKEYLAHEIVQVLGLDSLPALAGPKMLVELGMDSMMALELRNRFESDLGCSFPATIAFDYPTPDALLEHLVSELPQ